LPRTNAADLFGVDVVARVRRNYSRHLSKSYRHRKLACAPHREVAGIILFNQIFGLTKPRANGIVPGSVFFLETDKVELWN
jgi:hypothetical protein